MMNVPFYTSTREYKQYKAEFDSAIASVLESGSFILGKEVAELEEEVKAFTGAQYAVGVANGSDALVIASDILGYTEGAEVLTPTFTFFASTSCIVRNKAKPVFCDVHADTFNIDLKDAENRITSKTKGIVPVHLFLQTADMNATLDLAKKHKLSVLEDAAEAFGMKTLVNGEYKSAGTIGDMGVYSFFPTKTLGGYGDGGMIVTNSEELYKKAKSLRVHGSSVKYHHDYVGYNSRLDTLQAAILRIKLNRMNESITRRAVLASQYCSELAGLSEVILPVVRGDQKEVYYVFNVQAQKRDELAQYLGENGIGTSVYYPIPLHLQKCFASLGHKKGDFPVAEALCQTAIALPLFPELTESEVSYVCEKIREFYKKN